MPLYSYKCLKCGRNFENLSIAGNNEGEVECPSCGSTQVSKKFSSFSVGKSSSKSPPPCAGNCPGGGCSMR